jgi:hypothetical protein
MMMGMTKRFFGLNAGGLYAMLLLLVANFSMAQGKAAAVGIAEQMMEKTMKDLDHRSGFAIRFESIAFGVGKPKDIFTLPIYKVYKGGFVFMENDKCEYNMGMIKMLSDGKLYVYVDEASKSIVIDSVRNGTEEVGDVFAEMFPGNSENLTYTLMGKDTIGRFGLCNLVRCDMTKDKSHYSLYWIDAKTGFMRMYAEYQEGRYNVYLISKISAPPSNHNYTVYVPKAELTTLAGYEVYDNRFVNVEEARKINQKIKDIK